MQTFLPYSDFAKSARSLDNSRLGNQCYRECLTLINGGWKHHPAAKMWRNYEHAFCKYALALAYEMQSRNHWKPDVAPRWIAFWQAKMTEFSDTGNPSWLGDSEFHTSHQSNLIRKNSEHYSPQFPNVPDNLEYVWPV